jgi:hypothetical protein
MQTFHFIIQVSQMSCGAPIGEKAASNVCSTLRILPAPDTMEIHKLIPKGFPQGAAF